MSESRPPVALSIAGSDPSGGAGIQADVVTFAAHGVLGQGVVTALTVQSARGVRAVHPVEPALVRAQLDALLEVEAPAALKLGMLAQAETVRTIAQRLVQDDLRSVPVVLDPVLAATRGPELLGSGGLEALREALLPRVDVLTPNLDEAAALLGRPFGEVLMRPEAACRELAGLGPRAVVLKGGHAGGATSEDLVWCDGELRRLSADRVDTPNDHGTGCAFAAALAARLARGEELFEAARGAKGFVTRALVAAREWHIAGGSGPLFLMHARPGTRSPSLRD